MSVIELVQIGLLLIISIIGLRLWLVGQEVASQWQRYGQVEEAEAVSRHSDSSRGYRLPPQRERWPDQPLVPDYRSARQPLAHGR